jgi:sugar O-acyltransferase (sialic acid O-acetyltransferase NeuD family)
MDRVVVFGNGILAGLMHFYLTHDSPYEVAAFTVDGQYKTDETYNGLPVVSFEEVEQVFPPNEFQMSIPVSYRRLNRIRAERYDQAKAKGYRLINYISSKASIWPGLVTGDNCIITEGCVVQPFADVGNNVFMGCGSLVGHHAVIGDHCFIGPGAVTLGYVRVGPYTLLGANSTVRDAISIASECIIGAGVTISHNTEPKQVFMGARPEAVPKSSDELREWLTWRF